MIGQGNINWPHYNKGTGCKKQFSEVLGGHLGPGVAKGSVQTMNIIKYSKFGILLFPVAFYFYLSS